MKITYHDQVGFIPEMQDWFNMQKSINLILRINRLKDRNPMVLSIIIVKTIYKVHNPLIIKFSTKCKCLNYVFCW